MPSAGKIPTWLQVTVCSAHLTQRVVIFFMDKPSAQFTALQIFPL